MKYLLAIRLDGKNEILSFDSIEHRTAMIKDLERMFPGIEYATSEVSKSGPPTG